MTIINNLDLGAHPTWQASQSTRVGAVWGGDTQSEIVEGGQEIFWSRSGLVRARQETIWVTVSPSDPVAVLRLVRQLQELSGNPNMQPVFIQWQSGAGNILSDPEDGWYTLESVTPNEEVAADGSLQVDVKVSYLAPGLGSRALALTSIGGPAAIGWGGPSLHWLSYPPNSLNVPFPVNRFGGEGYIPVSYQLPPGISLPQLFGPSPTISDLFKGRVTVYDTINTISNPVPTGGGNAAAGWVEVFHPDHTFVGDCVISNDLILLLFQDAATNIAQVYFWNISTNQWQLAGSLGGNDSGPPNPSTWNIQGWTLGRISYRETSILINMASTNNNWCQFMIRVIAGAHYIRIRFLGLSQNNSRQDQLFFTPSVNSKLINYTDLNVLDNSLSLEQISMPLSVSSFGYSGCFVANSGLPMLFGWLYLDSTGQLFQGDVLSNGIAIGDTNVGPLINIPRFYGFYVSPWPNPQNLQAEGESGILGTGWSVVANANASGGQEAKAASGTGSNQRDIFGNSLVPPAGAYDVWFHMRVTSSAGSTPEMTLGLWDDDGGGGAGAYTPGGSRTFSANQIPTTYTNTGSNWVKANPTTPVVPTPGHRMRFRATTAATLGTDWFVDEAVLVPISMLPSFNSLDAPHDIWPNFTFDKQSRVVPL